MNHVEIRSWGDAVRLVARTCATGTVQDAIRVSLQACQGLELPVAVWEADTQSWHTAGALRNVPDPFEEHDWFVVPVVVGGSDITAVLMSPSHDDRDKDLLSTLGDLLTCAAIRGATVTAAADLASRLEEFQDLAGLGTFEWNIATGQVTWSSVMHGLHGTDPCEFSPDYASWLALTVEGDRERQSEAHLRAIGSNEPWHDVVRIRRASDGRERWLRCRGRVVADHTGRPHRLVGICEDVTPAEGDSMSALAAPA